MLLSERKRKMRSTALAPIISWLFTSKTSTRDSTKLRIAKTFRKLWRFTESDPKVNHFHPPLKRCIALNWSLCCSEVDENMIEELLKYNSGVKSFQSVDSRTLSPAIDGFRLNNQCWLTRRPRTTPSQLKWKIHTCIQIIHIHPRNDTNLTSLTFLSQRYWMTVTHRVLT